MDITIKKDIDFTDEYLKRAIYKFLIEERRIPEKIGIPFEYYFTVTQLEIVNITREGLFINNTIKIEFY